METLRSCTTKAWQRVPMGPSMRWNGAQPTQLRWQDLISRHTWVDLIEAWSNALDNARGSITWEPRRPATERPIEAMRRTGPGALMEQAVGSAMFIHFLHEKQISASCILSRRWLASPSSAQSWDALDIRLVENVCEEGSNYLGNFTASNMSDPNSRSCKVGS